ncbi:hypothetical protein E2C01_095953 [Portunus trituberculatus]|uniref:Uncharacterized protein n=1 Tax=Portunus trituberculatus TaxID=210409 RepID=A0A5B7K0F0_PORTR|nr:hypothetical protein [Portunus trituberculatus]
MISRERLARHIFRNTATQSPPFRLQLPEYRHRHKAVNWKVLSYEDKRWRARFGNIPDQHGED